MKLKFRVWDDAHPSLGMKFFYSDKHSATDFWGWIEDHNIKDGNIQQWVGLTDINKKDIYEGDIVVQRDATYKDCSIFKGQVKYSIPNAGFGLINKKGRETSLGGAEISLEVLGNIFENPELL